MSVSKQKDNKTRKLSLLEMYIFMTTDCSRGKVTLLEKKFPSVVVSLFECRECSQTCLDAMFIKPVVYGAVGSLRRYLRNYTRADTSDSSNTICMRKGIEGTECHFRVHDLSFSWVPSSFLRD